MSKYNAIYKMRFLIIVIIAFFAFQSFAACQTMKDTSLYNNYTKNVVFGTFGLFPNFMYNFNYERRITHPIKDARGSINLRLGYGKYLNLVGSQKLFLLSSNFILGTGSVHFETDLGAAYLFNIERMNYEKKTGITPIINLGFRFQKQNGPFVFRTGIGWPDCIYVSLGLAF